MLSSPSNKRNRKHISVDIHDQEFFKRYLIDKYHWCPPLPPMAVYAAIIVRNALNVVMN